jgi:phosphoglucosamine mutase
MVRSAAGGHVTDAPIAFGTDGIRGPAGTHPIVPDVGHRVGRAAAELARRSGGEAVVVGRDPRPSGVALARAVAAGVVEGGGLARDAGVVPTAALQVAVHGGLAHAGVMITASHNPEGDNGFKLLGARGRKLDDATCAEVEQWLSDPPREAPERTGRVDEVGAAVTERWLAAVKGSLVDVTPIEGRHVVVDLANGALAPHREAIDELFGLTRVTWLGTGGPVNAGCGSEHLEALSAKVRALGCDGGFAVDGDGDRCRIVDESGREVPGDAVTWRLARDARARGIAVTLMSNGALERELPGVQIVRTPVGDRFLREAMEAHGLSLGAEESGHVLFSSFPGGDGLLTGLRTLAAAWRVEKLLSDAFAGFRPLPRRLTRVVVRTRPPLDEVVSVQRARTVGLERLGPTGRVFLRYSGTEPVLRILVEGEPANVVDAVSAAVTSAANRALT